MGLPFAVEKAQSGLVCLGRHCWDGKDNAVSPFWNCAYDYLPLADILIMFLGGNCCVRSCAFPLQIRSEHRLWKHEHRCWSAACIVREIHARPVGCASERTEESYRMRRSASAPYQLLAAFIANMKRGQKYRLKGRRKFKRLENTISATPVLLPSYMAEYLGLPMKRPKGNGWLCAKTIDSPRTPFMQDMNCCPVFNAFPFSSFAS